MKFHVAKRIVWTNVSDDNCFVVGSKYFQELFCINECSMMEGGVVVTVGLVSTSRSQGYSWNGGQKHRDEATSVA